MNVRGEARLHISMIALLLLVQCDNVAEAAFELDAGPTLEHIQASIRRLDAAPACCEDLGALNYVELPEKFTRLPVDPSVARSFDEGKSHFLGIRIAPTSNPAMTVVVSPARVQSGKGTLPSIFAPSILVLDEQHQVVQKLVDVPLCYAQGWKHETTGYFATLLLDPRVHRYLVLYTTPSALAGSTRYQNSVTTAGGGAAMTFNTDLQFPHSPDGEVGLWMANEKMNKYLARKCAATAITIKRPSGS